MTEGQPPQDHLSQPGQGPGRPDENPQRRRRRHRDNGDFAPSAPSEGRAQPAGIPRDEAPRGGGAPEPILGQPLSPVREDPDALRRTRRSSLDAEGASVVGGVDERSEGPHTPIEGLGVPIAQGIDRATATIARRNREVPGYNETQEAWKKEITWLDNVRAKKIRRLEAERDSETISNSEAEELIERAHEEYRDFLSHVLAEMQTNSERDPLTKLYKRNALEDAAKKAISHAARKDENVTVAILDLDLFKQINDTYGHPVGDDVLRAVAQYLTNSVRGDDVVARLGGEELGILLPATTKENAAILIQKILTEMPDKVRGILAGYGTSISRDVTASIGFDDMSSFMNKREATLTDMLENADRPLYEAKRGEEREGSQGRDQAVYRDRNGRFVHIYPSL